MTTNLWSEQREPICLNCARRIVAPRHGGSKYASLREYLWRRGQFTGLITLDFRTIEGIIQSDLPIGALRSEEWWNNNETTTQGYAWTNAGWKVQSIDMKERKVTFKKAAKEEPSQPRIRRKAEAQKPFTPVPVKPYRMRIPSKTRVAKAVARAKNVERRIAAARYGVRFKPRPAYEKRLYKPEAKPTSRE